MNQETVVLSVVWKEAYKVMTPNQKMWNYGMKEFHTMYDSIRYPIALMFCNPLKFVFLLVFAHLYILDHLDIQAQMVIIRIENKHLIVAWKHVYTVRIL